MICIKKKPKTNQYNINLTEILRLKINPLGPDHGVAVMVSESGASTMSCHRDGAYSVTPPHPLSICIKPRSHLCSRIEHGPEKGVQTRAEFVTALLMDGFNLRQKERQRTLTLQLFPGATKAHDRRKGKIMVGFLYCVSRTLPLERCPTPGGAISVPIFTWIHFFRIRDSFGI